MGERLKLITSFSELRAGDLVFVMMCQSCGRQHSGRLKRFVSNALGRLPGDKDVERNDAWIMDADCGGLPPGITDVAVGARVVFVVDTGLSLDTTEETSRPLEVVR